MTSHEERAYAVEAMIGVHLQTASHPEVVNLLAAEFAAVEAPLQQRVAVLEAALSDYGQHELPCVLARWEAGRPTASEGYEHCYAGVWYEAKPADRTPPCTCGLNTALSGEPTALLKMLERAVEAGRKAGMHDQQFVTGGYGRTEPDEPDSDIAKRVWEGK